MLKQAEVKRVARMNAWYEFEVTWNNVMTVISQSLFGIPQRTGQRLSKVMLLSVTVIPPTQAWIHQTWQIYERLHLELE